MAGKGRTAITASQRRKIYMLAKKYGLDNDLLHVHIQTVTGRESLKKLSLGEAVRVIDSLEQRQADQMTWRQKCLIDRLLQELGWTDEQGETDYKRLDGWQTGQAGHWQWQQVRQRWEESRICPFRKPVKG